MDLLISLIHIKKFKLNYLMKNNKIIKYIKLKKNYYKNNIQEIVIKFMQIKYQCSELKN